jgi:hypothetical protein
MKNNKNLGIKMLKLQKLLSRKIVKIKIKKFRKIPIKIISSLNKKQMMKTNPIFKFAINI